MMMMMQMMMQGRNIVGELVALRKFILHVFVVLWWLVPKKNRGRLSHGFKFLCCLINASACHYPTGILPGMMMMSKVVHFLFFEGTNVHIFFVVQKKHQKIQQTPEEEVQSEGVQICN